MLDERTSEIISRIRLYALLGVVVVHSAPSQTTALMDVLANRGPSACVPLFFLISGFFLLQKPIETFAVAKQEWKKRARSLLMPFLFWNVAMYAGIVMLWAAHPSVLEGTPYALQGASIRSAVASIAGIGRAPIHYQFWFLRNLLILVLLAPLLRRFLLQAPWLGLALALLVEPFELLSGCPYFFAGGILAQHGSRNLFLVGRPLVVVGACAGFLMSTAFVPVPEAAVLAASAALFVAMSNIRIVGARARSWFASLSESAFFIYAVHEPLATLIRGTVQGLLRSWAFGPELGLVATAMVSIAVAWAMARLLRRRAPALWAVSTGDRGAPGPTA